MDFKDRIISIIPLFLIIIVIYSFAYFVQTTYSTEETFNILMWLTPISFAITFGLIIFSFFWSYKELYKLFKKINKKTWIALLIIFIVGLSLRTFYAPHTHRLYYDDDIYLAISQNIARHGKIYVCGYGTQDECLNIGYNKQPNGYSFLVSIPFFLFGTNESLAHYFTAIVSSMTIIIVFLIAYLMFKSKKIGILSSLIFVFIPITIRWAPTTSQGPIFLFFSALTVLAFLIYFKSFSNKIFLFSFASLAYTIQIRTEGFLLIFLIALMFMLLNKDLTKKIKDKDNLIIFSCFSILIIFLSLIYLISANTLNPNFLIKSPDFIIIVFLAILFFSITIFMFDKIRKWQVMAIIICLSLLLVPHIIHMGAVKGESWGAEGEKISLEYLDKNLEDNTMFFFENTRFPVVFTLLSLIGLAYHRLWKKKMFLGAWFLLFFVLYLSFYAGSFNAGVDVRFSLALYVPIAIFAGLGAVLISEILKKIVKQKFISIGVVAILITISFIPFYGFAGSVGQEAWSARLAHDFIIEEMQDLDDDSWIFTYVPSVVLINGKNAVYSDYVFNKEIVNKIFKETENVYFFEEYWCAAQISPYKDTCDYFHENFDLKEIANVTGTGRGMTRTFTLYKMTR